MGRNKAGFRKGEYYVGTSEPVQPNKTGVPSAKKPETLREAARQRGTQLTFNGRGYRLWCKEGLIKLSDPTKLQSVRDVLKKLPVIETEEA